MCAIICFYSATISAHHLARKVYATEIDMLYVGNILLPCSSVYPFVLGLLVGGNLQRSEFVSVNVQFSPMIQISFDDV